MGKKVIRRYKTANGVEILEYDDGSKEYVHPPKPVGMGDGLVQKKYIKPKK
jgi:hypothetical protein